MIYNIAFVCNDNYIIATTVAITSLMENKKDRINYNIYIVVDNITSTNRECLINLSKKYNFNLFIREVPSEIYSNIYQQHDGNVGAGSIISLLKFDLANVIDDDRVLYLDSDIIIRKDISEIFEVELGERYAAVVKDSGKIYNKGGLRGELPKYFNSGVMLLNLAAMRSDNVRDKLIEAKRKLKNQALVDQDAFNIVFRGKVILLPIKYNALMINLYNSIGKFSMKEINDFYGTVYSSFYDLEDDISILHFASKIKPWLYDDTRYSNEWISYYVMSTCRVPVERVSFFKNKEKFTEIPIILATDENYTPQTSVTIISVMENGSLCTKYKFYILTPYLFNKETLSKFNDIMKKYPNCSISYIEMKDAFKDIKLNIPHITSPTFYRLNAPSLFPQYDKIIYLDSDVIVEENINEYFSINIDDYYLAGVKAASYHAAKNGNAKYCRENGLPAIDQYINAGVILLNLKALRRNGIEREFIRRTQYGYRSQDQDIINGACYNHIKHIHYKYNCMITKYENVPEQLLNIFSKEEVLEAHNKPIIIHYAAEEKPWKSFSCALSDRWWKYCRLSPYYNDFLLRYNNEHVLREKLLRYLSCDRTKLLAYKNKEKNKQNSNTNHSNKITNEIVDSKSYLIGRVITYIPRKIMGGIICYKEHGLLYTLNRIKKKLMDK